MDANTHLVRQTPLPLPPLHRTASSTPNKHPHPSHLPDHTHASRHHKYSMSHAKYIFCALRKYINICLRMYYFHSCLVHFCRHFPNYTVDVCFFAYGVSKIGLWVPIIEVQSIRGWHIKGAGVKITDYVSNKLTLSVYRGSYLEMAVLWSTHKLSPNRKTSATVCWIVITFWDSKMNLFLMTLCLCCTHNHIIPAFWACQYNNVNQASQIPYTYFEKLFTRQWFVHTPTL